MKTETYRIMKKELAAFSARGLARWAHPGWAYATWASGPSFHTDVCVARIKHFRPDPDQPGWMVANYDLPDWPLSS